MARNCTSTDRLNQKAGTPMSKLAYDPMHEKADKIYQRVLGTILSAILIAGLVAVFKPIEFVLKPGPDRIGIVYDAQRNIVDVVRDDVYIRTWDKEIEFYSDFTEFYVEMNEAREEEFSIDQDYNPNDASTSYDYVSLDSVIAVDEQGYTDYATVGVSFKLTLAQAIAYLNSRPAEEKMLDFAKRDHAENDTRHLAQIASEDLGEKLRTATLNGTIGYIEWQPTGVTETLFLDDVDYQYLNAVGEENVQYIYDCELSYYEPLNVEEVQDEYRLYLENEFGISPALTIQLSHKYTDSYTVEPCDYFVLQYPDEGAGLPQMEPRNDA